MKSDFDRISQIMAQGAAKKGHLEGTTRRQQKHEMLLNFYAQAEKLQHKPAPKQSLLKTFMSLFL